MESLNSISSIKNITNLKRAVINFTGDIMANMSQNKACKIGEDYDYKEVFKKVKPLLSDCDYCVGNLETPLAGEESGFSEKMYSFNTPEAFADSLRFASFDLVATANNHCLDRGVEGLFSTLDVLDRNELDHIGTYRDPSERNSPFLRVINGIRICFINFTYGTNAFANHCFLQNDEQFAVNLFQPQETLPGSIHLLNDSEQIAKEVEGLYRRPNSVYDNEVKQYLQEMEADVHSCRREGAEFIFVIMHSGGQYNSVPDAYTEYLVERIQQAGADMIIGHHPHVVHRFEYKNGTFPVAYSLGNFSFTPGQSPDARKNPISETSLVFQVELEHDGDGVIISNLCFSVTRSVILVDGKSIVIPMFELIDETKDQKLKEQLIEDNQQVVNTFLSQPLDTPVPVKKEYLIRN